MFHSEYLRKSRLMQPIEIQHNKIKWKFSSLRTKYELPETFMTVHYRIVVGYSSHPQAKTRGINKDMNQIALDLAHNDLNSMRLKSNSEGYQWITELDKSSWSVTYTQFSP